jgi:alcohol dehydrogenase (cytochrome c)
LRRLWPEINQGEIMSITKSLGVVLAASLLCGTCLSAAKAGEVKDYTPVTQQRLDNPEPGNWLLYRRTYDDHGFSPLKQINANNVKDLVPVWEFSTGVIEGHEAPPMVNNGVMFVTTPYDHVLALDAATGKLIWEYRPKLPPDLFQLHPTNRGVALWGDNLYLATVDSRLIALDARTGKKLWQAQIGDYKKGYYSTLEPLVVNGKVMVGTSGGEFGVRGFIKAFDAKTGKLLWTTYTIPAPGQPGHNTWKTDAWKDGGGPVWITGDYDPKRNIAYWGVGNAADWPGDLHPGDNLYTSSTIALDPDTGKIVAYHQYHWNDSWDWDEIRPPILIKNLNVDGHVSGDGLVHAARDGYLWVLEQNNKGIQFVWAKPFVEQNAFKSIDPETGRPTYDPAHKPTLGKMVNFCPSLWGGDDWTSESYSDQTHLLYIPAINNMCGEMEGVKKPLIPGQLWLGANPETLNLLPHGDHLGELQAWDLKTGKEVWVHKFPYQLMDSVLTTAGDLVFVGGTNDRMFRAFDAKTGKLLWQQGTNSGITAMPVAYQVGNTEYIAVVSGWGVDAQRQQVGLAKTSLKLDPNAVPQGGVIWVFALRHPGS